MRRENGGFCAHRPAMPPPADLASVSTLAELLQWRIAQTPQGEAYRQYDAARAAWASVSWRAFGERVARFARALAALGLARGERVALLLPNTLDAVTADQAVLALGGVPVPMHAIDNPESIAYILADSEAALLVADTKQQWQAIAATNAVPATLRHVVLRECARSPDAPKITTPQGSGTASETSPARSGLIG